ncbi:MAG TPA: hypothetical protein VGR02_20390 [Thermoanaerobaculia bacterium]|jgi:hypothetical protein|nr:hypothetical protein [Thermoanaerobaculia bacterium]
MFELAVAIKEMTMPVIEIYFRGLICFEGTEKEKNSNQTRKTRAVLVDTKNDHTLHTPHVVIDGQEKPVPKNATITFGVDPGPATVEASFERYVPHLAEVTAAGIELDLNELGRALVLLPGGKLETALLYPCKARHLLNGEKRKGCVARMTQLRLEADQVPIEVMIDGDKYPLSQWMLIENTSAPSGDEGRKCGDIPSRAHFRLYSALLSSANPNDVATVIQPGDECTDELSVTAMYLDEVLKHGTPTLVVATHSECSNSQWP